MKTALSFPLSGQTRSPCDDIDATVALQP
ncbi:protein of unknown function (plasmid) [Aminobacter niigataensis]|nr:protein of unknown function [Aminobacter niigataensis]